MYIWCFLPTPYPLVSLFPFGVSYTPPSTKGPIMCAHVQYVGPGKQATCTRAVRVPLFIRSIEIFALPCIAYFDPQPPSCLSSLVHWSREYSDVASNPTWGSSLSLWKGEKVSHLSWCCCVVLPCLMCLNYLIMYMVCGLALSEMWRVHVHVMYCHLHCTSHWGWDCFV